MIYPWDIARFREALEAGLKGPSFERFHFSKAVVRAGGEGSGHDISPGVSIEMSAPAAIFGAPAIASCLDGVATTRLAAPSARVETIENATILGLNSILDGDGHLYAPALCQDAAALRKALAANRSNAEGYVLREEDGDVVACFFSGRRRRRIAGTALLLSNLEIGNYGSFLIRVLPQLLQAKRWGRDFDAYISSDRSAWLPQAIALLGLPARPILLVQEVCGDTYDKVVTHTTSCVEGLFDPTTLSDIRRLIEAHETGRPTRRIYVSRQLSRVFLPHYRQLANEDAIVDRFAGDGFEIVFPETLSLLDQMRLFAEARTIAGPSGSGMLNAVFASGAKVLDIEGFNVTVRQHAKVYASSGHPYAFCFGRLDPSDAAEPSVRSWTVEPALLDEAVNWLDR